VDEGPGARGGGLGDGHRLYTRPELSHRAPSLSRLPHVVLPDVAPLVRTARAEHGITCSEFPTVSAAVRAHQRMLRRLGAPPAPPVSVLHEVDHVAN